jgi:hypothetical protein
MSLEKNSYILILIQRKSKGKITEKIEGECPAFDGTGGKAKALPSKKRGHKCW